MSATGGAGASEAELRAMLRRVIILDVQQGDFLPTGNPDWEGLNDAITELVVLRAQLAPVEDDYPSAVFRELWRVLEELRAGTGENRRCRQGDDD
jgi:hypothetical protein